MAAVITPAPARSTAKPATRNKLEALVLAGLAVARAPLPLSPCKTPGKPVGLEAAERRLLAAEAVQADGGDSASADQVNAAEPTAAAAAAGAVAAGVEGDGSCSAASADADAEVVAEEEHGPAGKQSASGETILGVAAPAEQQQGEEEKGVVSPDVAAAEAPAAMASPGAEQLAAAEAASPSLGRARLFSESAEVEVAEVEAGLEPAPATGPAEGSAASMRPAEEPERGSPQLSSKMQPAELSAAGEGTAATGSEAATGAPELPAVLLPLGSPVAQQQEGVEVAAVEELAGSPAPQEHNALDADMAAGERQRPCKLGLT